MHRLPFFLLAAALLAAPRPARALPGDMVFNVVIPDGPDPLNADTMGTMYFMLEDEQPDLCRYYAVWSSPPGGAVETGCHIDELKLRGHVSCTSNSRVAFTTMVERNAKLPCSGLDTFLQPQSLFLLVGMESASLTGIFGLIQYSASSPFVYPFEALPYP